MKKLLLVAHCPSPNTEALRDAVLAGARHVDIAGVETSWIPPLETTPKDVLAADAVLLGTTENLGYMSGALKDFFDRCYYPVLEEKQGMAYGLYIRAGHDGTGTKRAVETIVTGLRWKAIQPALVLRGAYDPAFSGQCEELGMAMAAGLEAGIF